MDAYVSKPIRTTELFATIERVLAKSHKAGKPIEAETREKLTR
jgi:hypothetical protein